jgi:hypothetical protein
MPEESKKGFKNDEGVLFVNAKDNEFDGPGLLIYNNQSKAVRF